MIEDNKFRVNYKIKLDKDNFLSNLKELITYQFCTSYNYNFIYKFFNSKKFKETSNKVALSGIAGDELFLGYYSHYLYWLLENKDLKNFETLKTDWFKITGSHVENPLIKDLENFLNNPNQKIIYLMTLIFFRLFNKKKYLFLY